MNKFFTKYMNTSDKEEYHVIIPLKGFLFSTIGISHESIEKRKYIELKRNHTQLPNLKDKNTSNYVYLKNNRSEIIINKYLYDFISYVNNNFFTNTRFDTHNTVLKVTCCSYDECLNVIKQIPVDIISTLSYSHANNSELIQYYKDKYDLIYMSIINDRIHPFHKLIVTMDYSHQHDIRNEQIDKVIKATEDTNILYRGSNKRILTFIDLYDYYTFKLQIDIDHSLEYLYNKSSIHTFDQFMDMT